MKLFMAPPESTYLRGTVLTTTGLNAAALHDHWAALNVIVGVMPVWVDGNTRC